MAITGQRPYVRRARQAISNFKLREGNPIGVALTLRGVRMWEFYDRLVTAALPARARLPRRLSRRLRRPRELLPRPDRAVDLPGGQLRQHDRVRGLQVNIVTTAPSDEEGKRLLELLGMPFRR